MILNVFIFVNRRLWMLSGLITGRIDNSYLSVLSC
jgi:hypothetical protein